MSRLMIFLVEIRTAYGRWIMVEMKVGDVERTVWWIKTLTQSIYRELCGNRIRDGPGYIAKQLWRIVEVGHRLACFPFITSKLDKQMAIKKQTEPFDLQGFATDFFRKCQATTVKKNADYAGAVVNDPFSNFTLIEKTGAATAEQGFLTRMSDKFARISTFVKNGELQVKTESVQDTLKDLANYAMLMAAYLESKKD